jgi:endo-1,4-beta-xylanase
MRTRLKDPCIDSRHGRVNALIQTCAFLLCGIVLFPQQSPSQLAKGQNRFVGNVLGAVMWSDFDTYWNQVTAENAGKWGSVEGSQGSYYWTPLDNIYSYAINRGFPYKHHTLVWGQQEPSWIANLDSASQRAAVQKWIDTVAQRYVSASLIDVVNEPFHAVPSYANALGGSGATGWDWVVRSFQMARGTFFRTVKLILNEYNVLQDNTVTTNFLKLIDTLRVRGLIDGIGIQGHGFEFKGSGYTYPVSTLKYNLGRLVATGLPVYISEFDISEADDQTQLQDYQTYFSLFWENPGVKGITLWGYLQGNIWRQDGYLIRSNGTERPALTWLRIYVATPKPVSPVGTSGEPRNAILVWRSSTPATSYHLQVAADSAFTSLIVDTGVADTVLQVSPLDANTTYYWRVSAVNANGESLPSTPAIFTTGDLVGVSDDVAQIPDEFRLFQNHPNPFNPTTLIRYDLPRLSSVRLTIYNMLGEKIRTVVDATHAAGEHTVVWDAKDDHGMSVSTGVYLYRLETGTSVLTRKMMLMH